MSWVSLFPKSQIENQINIPGSKSITNRAILIAAISNGTSKIYNFLKSDDTRYMFDSLKNLGVKIEENKDHLTIEGNNGNFNKIINNELFCGIAGTTSRFLTGLSVLIDQQLNITGEKKILERPIEDLVDAITKLGVNVDYKGKIGSLPITTISKSNLSNEVQIEGNISSQFISALLMVAPRLKNGLTIKIKGDQVSKSYIDITLSIMKDFGVNVINKNYQEYIIKNQEYKAQKYIVEGDWSSASYFLAASVILKQPLILNNLKPDSTQGDYKTLNIFNKFGLEYSFNANQIITRPANKIQNDSVEVDMSQMPDTAMTIMILSAVTNIQTKITGLSTLKDKECDRIEVPKLELAKFGIIAETTNDSIIIYKTSVNRQIDVTIKTHEDHRIAMAFSLFGLAQNITIKDYLVVNKSFPSYWQEFAKIASIIYVSDK